MLAEPPPGAAEANSTPKTQKVANARTASRWNKFFTALLRFTANIRLPWFPLASEDRRRPYRYITWEWN
jgi:hypothetical protein